MNYAEKGALKNGNGDGGKRNGQKTAGHLTGMMYLKFSFLVIFSFAAVFYLSVKIFRLKNEYGDEYERKAISQLINWGSGSEQSIRPNRGAILDRNRQTLAYSTVVYNVFVDIRLLSQRNKEIIQKSFETVNSVLGIPMGELYALLDTDEEGRLIKDTNYYVIAKQLPQSIAAEISKDAPWDVYLEEDSKRSYVYGGVAPQVIGFVRDVGWGLEGYYDKELSGTYGRAFRTYDSNGKSVVSERVEPEEGYTLISTLDLSIQQSSEKIAEKYGKEYNADNACVIVMNPNTGEILSMASYPSFNLNDPLNLEYVTKEQYALDWSELTQAEQIEKLYTLWKNYNITSTFEPGSIFKPITVAAALEEGIISTSDTYYCPGYKQVAGYTIHCHLRSGHGHLTLDEALAQSCNVALMDIAEKMGRETFYKYQRDFGYGEKTGVDLPGEESASALLHSLSGLGTSELATSSFGQRFNCTPLQAITAFCALINGGDLHSPYVVSQILDQNQGVVSERKPEAVRKVISKETSDYIREALIGTLVYGTGKKAFIDGYTIGGKSGTAEQGIRDTEGYHFVSSFIGYFPAEAPEYVALVMIVNPEGTPPSASVMFKELVLDIIGSKAIPPSTSVAANGQDSMTLGDYRGKPLIEAVKSLNNIGVDFELIGGSGTVIGSQFPAPGTKITKDSMVFLMIEEGEDGDLGEIPDVAGMTAKVAAEAVSNAGFTPVVSFDNPENDDGDAALVYEQMPGPYLRLPKGVEVKIKAK